MLQVFADTHFVNRHLTWNFGIFNDLGSCVHETRRCTNRDDKVGGVRGSE